MLDMMFINRESENLLDLPERETNEEGRGREKTRNNESLV